MAPTFVSGRVVIAIYPWGLRPGRVVVFVHEGKEKIKRIDRLEPGRAFVVGDNPALSTDSREFGWIDRRSIIGRIIVKL
jgi:phage repressor protein C with HTH and peptisase S24 domain